MSVSARHALRQGPVVRALLGAALSRLRRAPAEAPETPGPVATREVPARDPKLVHDYIVHCGGNPEHYGSTVPAHLFPQWGFPLLATRLRSTPYDLTRTLNGGCRMELHRPIPAGEPLQLAAHLRDIDDNGRRAVLQNHLVTGTESAPDALSATVYAIVPLAKGSSGEKKKERPSVPAEATEIRTLDLTPGHAVDFAMLTGDFNPIHWLRPYARMAGFRATILHGFATLAYAIEALNEGPFGGDPTRLGVIDVKFTRPLVLPATVGVYTLDRQIYVGKAPGGPAVLTGTFEEAHRG